MGCVVPFVLVFANLLLEVIFLHRLSSINNMYKRIHHLLTHYAGRNDASSTI